MTDTAKPHCLLLTHHVGTHPWVEQELTLRCQQFSLALLSLQFKPYEMRGLVRVEIQGERASVVKLVFALRSVHHVIEWIADLPLADTEPLERLADQLQGLGLDRMQSAHSFRISTHRVGTHPFGSEDVQRAAGAALQQQYGTAVDLRGYDLDVRVNVYEQTVVVGYQLTRESLSRRYEGRPYLRSVSLQANAAYVLVQAAGLKLGFSGRILDPFCGAGTILLEAGQVHPLADLWGGDVFPEPVAGAQANLAWAGLKATIFQADARELREQLPDESVDAIITNPPFGLRMGQKLNLKHFYQEVLTEMYRTLKPGAPVVMLVLKAAIFRQMLRQVPGLQVRLSQRIQLGNKQLRLYKLEKVAANNPEG